MFQCDHSMAGLLRAGATLPSAPLRQNPRFRAGMSGPQAVLSGAFPGGMRARRGFSVLIDDAPCQRIAHGVSARAIHDFLGEPPFSHDGNHVVHDAGNADIHGGTLARQAVRAAVKAGEWTSILASGLFGCFANGACWRHPTFNPRRARIA